MTDQNCMSPSFCIAPDCTCPGADKIEGSDVKFILTDAIFTANNTTTEQSGDINPACSNPVNKFGCAYLDCNCSSPCWADKPILPVINVGSIVVNGDVTVIVNKASDE